MRRSSSIVIALILGAMSISVSTVSHAVPLGQRPSPRHSAGLAYSSARGNLILFGGVTGDQILSDTWELRQTDEGLRWKRIRTTGPLLRPGMTMAENPTTGTPLLMGTGLASGEFELWEFDGSSWTQAENTGGLLGTPQPRQSHAVATHEALNGVVLFGGMRDREFLSDTCQWGATNRQWNRVSDSVPTARADHAMAYDHARDEVVMFGGSTRGIDVQGSRQELGDTWRFNGSTWRPSELPGPTPRSGHAMAYDRIRHVVVLYGGSDAVQMFGDTWLWNGTTWTPIPQEGPPPARTHHAMSTTAGGEIILFGGLDGSGTDLADTWSWSGSSWRNIEA